VHLEMLSSGMCILTFIFRYMCDFVLHRLVSEDPHLLFQRVESQSRAYINNLKVS